MLLAIPDEHLLKFHGIKDAKTLWEAIKTRFGGNKELKKMQKTILKQQNENFTASRSERLDKTYDRLIMMIYEEMSSMASGHAYYETKDLPRRIVPVETLANALVVQDGIGSSSSDSEVHTCSKDCLKSYETLQKQYDQQRDALKKSNLEIIGYQLGLESLEARIVVHQKNEAVYEEDIAFLKYDVKVRDNSITELKNQLAEALREKDDLKLKLENQMNKNELHDCHLNKREVFKSASDSIMNEIEEENNQVNDRFKNVKGYHVVPPSYTGNYRPSRHDLSFVGLDDSVYKTNVSETITSVPRNESTASKSSKDSLEQPKDVRPSASIIEEWESDSDDDCVIRPSFKQNKPSYAKINFVKLDENTRKSVIKQNTYRQAENLWKSQSPMVDNFTSFRKSQSPKGGKITGK
ncbi:hypothetical protein Tco_1484296, partial [Tanacetum coccineum]